jgi:hypothetical protein
MYAAALLMLLGVPVALGSWWGVLVWLALLPTLAWRLIDEERMLLREFDGYADYRRKVRWRLMPASGRRGLANPLNPLQPSLCSGGGACPWMRTRHRRRSTATAQYGSPEAGANICRSPRPTHC